MRKHHAPSSVQLGIAAAIGGYFLAIIAVAVANDIINTLRTGGAPATGMLPRAITAFWGQLVAGVLALACAASSTRANRSGVDR